MIQMRPVIMFVVCLQWVLTGCVTVAPAKSISAFTTDGCSMFPDRSLATEKDWNHCCVVHDWAYWRGGTAKQRKAADDQLRMCVASSTGNTALADLMYAGARSGGSPHFHTSYRWGYGWPYGRGYKALSPSEQASAAAQEARYREDNAALSSK